MSTLKSTASYLSLFFFERFFFFFWKTFDFFFVSSRIKFGKRGTNNNTAKRSLFFFWIFGCLLFSFFFGKKL